MVHDGTPTLSPPDIELYAPGAHLNSSLKSRDRVLEIAIVSAAMSDHLNGFKRLFRRPRARHGGHDRIDGIEERAFEPVGKFHERIFKPDLCRSGKL